MFRKNVTFQLAMILLVVIVSYAVNVRDALADVHLCVLLSV
jgi:hypothetical protein